MRNRRASQLLSIWVSLPSRPPLRFVSDPKVYKDTCSCNSCNIFTFMASGAFLFCLTRKVLKGRLKMEAGSQQVRNIFKRPK